MATKEQFAHAADLLVKVAAFAAAPSLITFGAATAGGYLNLRSLVGAGRVPDLSTQVAEDLQNRLTVLGPELPSDADILFLQMLEFGAPNASDLIAEDLDARAIAELISSRATGPDYASPGLKTLFVSWITPSLAAIIEHPDFVSVLAPSITRATLERLSSIGLDVETLRMDANEFRAALAETTALVKSIDQSLIALRDGIPYEEAVIAEANVPVAQILAARIALGTYSIDEVKEIRRRLDSCMDRFKEIFDGDDRKVCFCRILTEVKKGNGGTLPDPEWQRQYDELGC